MLGHVAELAVVEAGDDEGGLYRSDDGGDNWTRVNSERVLRARSWYYMHIFADPVDADTVAMLERTFSGRRFVVQPFIANIRTEGEYSLFFFNGEYSHAILKVPKAGDFRVQEEHGADIIPARPPADLLAVGHKVFSHVQPLPAYGRGDWVRGPDGHFLLMELELIEPSLYLRTDPGAAARFARAFDQWFQKCASE